MKQPRLIDACWIFILLWSAPSMALPLGALVHDGPATPEQLSLYLPVTGSLDTAATATVRYRPTLQSSWAIAHPLHRIRPEFTLATVADAFAGVITGLVPGVDYTIEVTVSSGGSTDVKTLVSQTRALPPPAPPANKIIAAGSTSAQIQSAFDELNPGDVLQFDNGTYDIDDLTLRRNGAPAQPIYIRGASRDGVVLRDPTGRLFYLVFASHLIIEDLTLKGSGVDSGGAASSRAFQLWNGETQRDVTIRRVTASGIDIGVAADHYIEQILVYDCTFSGNNEWTEEFIATNLTWNDDGIRAPGAGNAVFNNTMSGFGDTFAMNDYVENVGVHFYRNDILMTGDDAYEGDYGFRNLTFYDNRIHNSMTLASFDPIRGGPSYVFRNIAINTGRSPYKLNATNTGHFIYNNTVVRTNGVGSGALNGWNQSNNGPQRAWGYRNNILIYRGDGNHLMAMESSGQSPIDFTNNAWFPDRAVWWTFSGGSYTSMEAARDALPSTSPVFGSSTQRHENDVISENDPFIHLISLGNTYLTQITTLYTPTLASGTAPRSGGVIIPGITDGFSGSAPDMGAIITGVAPPTWGDRYTAPAPDIVPPARPENVTAIPVTD